LRCFVTGCAGFIGSALTDRLLADGHAVVGYDNFSTGQSRFLAEAQASPRFQLIPGELMDARTLEDGMRGSDIVFHLAAHADVRFGADHPRRDLEQNTLGTYEVLRAMKATGVTTLAFTSSGSVYGDATMIPTPEHAPFPVQTSFYGASKAAAEGLIAAHCAAYGFQAHIFRLVSILGERYSHGHIVDFYRQLSRDAGSLRVLGDGRQRKSYLYVQDCIDAMLIAVDRSTEGIGIFNLGHDTACTVSESIARICEALKIEPQVRYGGGERGWVGDSPRILLDTQRIRALGWTPRLNIAQSIARTLDYLRANAWVLDARP
jgi:UDP-glucose 4-epimerase